MTVGWFVLSSSIFAAGIATTPICLLQGTFPGVPGMGEEWVVVWREGETPSLTIRFEHGTRKITKLNILNEFNVTNNILMDA